MRRANSASRGAFPIYAASPLAGLAALFATSGRKTLLRSAERSPWRLSRRPRNGDFGQGRKSAEARSVEQPRLGIS
jgi:hypothetical protein